MADYDFMVNVNDIIEHDGNRANGGKLEPLSSVKEMGIKVPLIVYQDKRGNFNLVDGHRRLFTAKMYGIDEVPVVIIPEEFAGETYAVANLDRKDLTTLDLYERAKEMLQLGKSVETVASVLNVSKYQFNRFMKLDNLIPEYIEMLKKGTITSAQAGEFAAFPKEAQQNSLKDKWISKQEAKCIRQCLNEYVGKSLKPFTDEFTTYSEVCGNCLECANNRASDNTLFGSATKEESVCSCPDKLAMKLLAFSNEKNCTGIIAEGKAASDWLAENGINPVSKDWTSYSEDKPSKRYSDQKKYMSCYGRIVWQGGESVGADKEEAELLERVDTFNADLISFVRYLIDESMNEISENVITNVNLICNKKASKRIIDFIKSNTSYFIKEDTATEKQMVGRGLFESCITTLTNYSVARWSSSNEQKISDLDKAITKWEPFAVKFPTTKKHWEKVIESEKLLREALVVKK